MLLILHYSDDTKGDIDIDIDLRDDINNSKESDIILLIFS